VRSWTSIRTESGTIRNVCDRRSGVMRQGGMRARGRMGEEEPVPELYEKPVAS
jgi:hypothetical protein